MVSDSHRTGHPALDTSPAPPPEAAKLTPRENEILAEIASGQSSKEVARSLAISPRTVEFHRANLLRKFEARNTADLMRKAASSHR